MRVIRVAACRAAALLRGNVVGFALHRQVCVLAAAMALRPALLTAPSGSRGGCLGAVDALGSLLAPLVTAAPRPPFPQPLAQFLELATRRLQLLFQPLLSRYRLAMHAAVIACLPAQLQYLAA